MTPTEMKLGLESALARGGEGYTIEDLEERLLTGQALLWTGEKSVLVTSLEVEDGVPSLHVWLGTGNLRELVSMEPGVSAWARARNCRYASIDGRHGWSRVFLKFGFEMVDGELRKYYV